MSSSIMHIVDDYSSVLVKHGTGARVSEFAVSTPSNVVSIWAKYTWVPRFRYGSGTLVRLVYHQGSPAHDSRGSLPRIRFRVASGITRSSRDRDASRARRSVTGPAAAASFRMRRCRFINVVEREVRWVPLDERFENSLPPVSSLRCFRALPQFAS